MANILHYNPADETFDDLFRGFFMRPVRVEGGPEAQIRIDVSEDSTAYTVHAEIPGVKKEDITVTIDGGQVSIGAEIKRRKDSKEGERIVRSERFQGKLSRSFTLPHEVDNTAAEARYVDGVLMLTLPKQTSSRSKNLTIR